MNNILIIYVENHKNMSMIDTINSFITNCSDIHLAQKSVCFTDNEKSIDIIKQLNIDIINYLDTTLFSNIEHVIYIPNDCIFTEKDNYISVGLNITKNNDKNIKQVIFCDHVASNCEYVLKNDIRIKLPIHQIYDYDDQFNKHEKIKNILKNQENIFIQKTNKLNMEMYVHHIYPEYYFKLLPSFISINKNADFPIFTTSANYFKYRQEYENNGYTSCYVNKNLKQNVQYINKTLADHNDLTIITGFINVNAAVKKKLYDYVEKSIPTLSIPQFMVIYVSPEIKDHVVNIRKQCGLMDKTKIIEISLEDLYMYDNIEKMKECSQKNISPYDNHLYVMSVNSRYNYLKKSIDNNYFNTNYFAWIDFGISHIVSMKKMGNIAYNNENKIKIAWIARYKNNFTWNHCAMGGGFFVGHKKTMLEYIKLHDMEFKSMLEFGHCVNDDRLIYLMFEKYPEIFDFYFSSYGHMILKF